jgi:hypothetical protein
MRQWLALGTVAAAPAQAMAIAMLAGRYVAHARVVNTLGLQPPVPSIFVKAPA